MVGHQNDSKGAIPFNPKLKAGVSETHFQTAPFVANLFQSKNPQERAYLCFSSSPVTQTNHQKKEQYKIKVQNNSLKQGMQEVHIFVPQ